jgi:hypothetical protein
VPVWVNAQSGLVFGTKPTETLRFVTVPLNNPTPERPSRVKVPESVEPIWMIAIVTLQPNVNCSQPVRVHDPDTSTGGLGTGAGDEHVDTAKEMTRNKGTCRMRPIVAGVIAGAAGVPHRELTRIRIPVGVGFEPATFRL